eukprot:scaffold1231_cov107-Cylindrotheca_fusiformis.AAC.1
MRNRLVNLLSPLVHGSLLFLLALLMMSNIVVAEEDVTVEVAVQFQFDDFPFETGWSLQRVSTGETVANYPIGSYSLAAVTDEVLFSLPPNVEYEVVLEDLKGDGMCCNSPGSVTVVQYGTVLGDGGGAFEFSQSIPFTTNSALTAPPSVSPTVSDTPGPTNFRPSEPTLAPFVRPTLNPAIKPTEFPSQMPSCTPIPVTCTLTIMFDGAPEKWGWSIARADTGQVIASRNVGYYGFDPQSTTEEIELLSEGVDYILNLDNGIEWSDSEDDADGDGHLTLVQEGRVTLVTAGSDFDLSRGVYPFSTVPECTTTQASIQTMVALTIDFGFFPEKIGWLLTDENDAFAVKASKPVGYHGSSDEVTPRQQAPSDDTSRTTFWLEAGGTYTFSITMQNVNTDESGERVTGNYKVTSVIQPEDRSDATIATGSYAFDGYGDASQSVTFTVPN